MRDAFLERLCKEAEKDERIVLITGDLGFKVLDDFRERFPERFINAGVAEQNMTTLAAGLALEGFIVWTYSIANFPVLRCLEQIRNDVCYHNLNVNIASIGGGFSYGPLGISHHATEDITVMRSLPDMTVCTPTTLYEAQEASVALMRTPGAGYLRIDKSYAPEPENAPPFELGKARCFRKGDDLTIFACGGILEEAIAAAQELSKDGIQIGIQSLHTIKPIDADAILNAAKNTGGILTLEEHTTEGGMGSAVAEVLMDNGLIPKQFKRMGLKSEFSSVVGSQSYLRSTYGLDSQHIIKTIRSLLKR